MMCYLYIIDNNRLLQLFERINYIYIYIYIYIYLFIYLFIYLYTATTRIYKEQNV